METVQDFEGMLHLLDKNKARYLIMGGLRLSSMPNPAIQTSCSRCKIREGLEKVDPGMVQ
jgi:hypothetical protein